MGRLAVRSDRRGRSGSFVCWAGCSERFLGRESSEGERRSATTVAVGLTSDSPERSSQSVRAAWESVPFRGRQWQATPTPSTGRSSVEPGGGCPAVLRCRPADTGAVSGRSTGGVGSFRASQRGSGTRTRQWVFPHTPWASRRRSRRAAPHSLWRLRLRYGSCRMMTREAFRFEGRGRSARARSRDRARVQREGNGVVAACTSLWRPVSPSRRRRLR